MCWFFNGSNHCMGFWVLFYGKNKSIKIKNIHTHSHTHSSEVQSIFFLYKIAIQTESNNICFAKYWNRCEARKATSCEYVMISLCLLCRLKQKKKKLNILYQILYLNSFPIFFFFILKSFFFILKVFGKI